MSITKVQEMNKDEIEPAVYLSIHSVPYRVLSVKDDQVLAKCETGKSVEFDMLVERFAEAMKSRY